MLAIALLATLCSQIQVADKKLTVEIANTPESQRVGLMGRRTLPPDCGMLFVFDREDLLAFWMKNTLIPLSIAFFDSEKRLIEVLDMPIATTNPPPLFKSSRPALYALEVPQGWFEENGITKNDLKFSFLDPENNVRNYQVIKQSIR